MSIPAPLCNYIDSADISLYSGQSPETRPARIGVITPWGQPRSFSSIPIFPEPLASEVNAVVERGKTDPIPNPSFNAASLVASTICPILDANLTVSSTEACVFSGCTQVTTTFNHDTINLVLTVDIYDGLDHPLAALMSYIGGFQIEPLADAIQTCNPQLGAYSFRTPDSAFWVRGNMFIRLEQFSDEPFDFAIAVKLDGHLAASPDRLEPPNLALDPVKLPRTVRCGETFHVKLGEDTWAAEKTAVSDSEDIVATRGLLDEEGQFEFYATGVGKARLTIVAAEKDSYRPVAAVFDVVVEDAEVEDPYAGCDIGEQPEPVVPDAEEITGVDE